MPDLTGTTLDGRFLVTRSVGQGGMARVWLAVDQTSGGPVAIKVVEVDDEEDARLGGRFEREISLGLRLRHPNLVAVHAFGRLPGLRWYAMDYLPCPDLSARLASRGRFPEDEVLSFLRQTVGALTCVHAGGVVHRDLKPANIMCPDDGRYVVMDFGLARDLERTRLTRTGTILGSPLYMSPELAQGRPADARSDLCQLGLIAWELLVGRRAYDATSLPQLLMKIIHEEPPPPSTQVDALGPGWDPLLAGCLARDPDRRWPTASALAAAVELVARGESPHVSPPPPERPRRRDRPPLPPRANPASTPASTPPRRRRPPLFLLLLLSLPLLLVAVFRAPPPVPFAALSLRARPRVGSCLVSWTSARPYPTRLLVGAGDSLRELSDGQGPVLSHQVLVEGLPDGGSAEARVLFPDGSRSLPLAVGAARVEVRPAASTVAGGALNLTCRVAPPPSGALVRRVGPAGPTEVEALVTDDLVTALLPAPETVRALSLQVTWPDGPRRSVDLGELVSSETATLTAALEAFRPQAFLLSRVGDLSPGLSGLVDTLRRGSEDLAATKREAAERGVAVRPLLQKCLDDAGLRRPTARVAELAPLAFRTGLLPLGVRRRLHAALLDLEAYRLFCSFSQAEIEAPSLPDLGPWALAHAPSPGAFDELPLRPRDAPPVRMGAYSRMFGLDANVPRLEMTADVAAPSTVTTAEIVIRVDGEFRWLALRVLVNDEFEGLVPDLRPDAPGGRRPTAPLVQGLPPSVLQEGPNRVALVADPLFGRFTRDVANVTAVTLRLGRFPASPLAPRPPQGP